MYAVRFVLSHVHELDPAIIVASQSQLRGVKVRDPSIVLLLFFFSGWRFLSFRRRGTDETGKKGRVARRRLRAAGCGLWLPNKIRRNQKQAMHAGDRALHDPRRKRKLAEPRFCILPARMIAPTTAPSRQATWHCLTRCHLTPASSLLVVLAAPQLARHQQRRRR